MTKMEPLFDQFCAALNAELAILGCRIGVMPRYPSRPQSMLLVDIEGAELGWVPDHVDAASIVAFDAILRHDRTARGQGACE